MLSITVSVVAFSFSNSSLRFDAENITKPEVNAIAYECMNAIAYELRENKISILCELSQRQTNAKLTSSPAALILLLLFGQLILENIPKSGWKPGPRHRWRKMLPTYHVLMSLIACGNCCKNFPLGN